MDFLPTLISVGFFRATSISSKNEEGEEDDIGWNKQPSRDIYAQRSKSARGVRDLNEAVSCNDLPFVSKTRSLVPSRDIFSTFFTSEGVFSQGARGPFPPT